MKPHYVLGPKLRGSTKCVATGAARIHGLMAPIRLARPRESYRTLALRPPRPLVYYAGLVCALISGTAENRRKTVRVCCDEESI